MTEKKDLTESYMKFKLTEALKNDPIYKDHQVKLAVVKNETDPHEAVSDFLLRVMPQDSINKMNYMLGLNPEAEIRKDPIPNPKKTKLKESSLLEDGAENAEQSKEDGNVEQTTDIENLPASGENSEEGTEEEANKDEGEAEVGESEPVEEPKEERGIGSFDRIINECESEEILKKAIEALNSNDIASARDVFYDWFDSYDDNHYEGSTEETEPEEKDEEPVNAEGNKEQSEEPAPEDGQKEQPAEDDSEGDLDLDIDDIFK